MIHIDLSAAKLPLTEDEKRQYMPKSDWWRRARFSAYVSSAVFVFGAGAIVSLGNQTILPLVVIAFFFSVIVLATWHTANKTMQLRARIARVAQANNIKAVFSVVEPGFDGLYFQIGDTRFIPEMYEIDSAGILIGTYSYMTGSGKNRSSHRIGFIRKTLPRRLPHMVLDNKSNNFWKLSNLPTYFNKDQTLSLEGDFDKYFTLYAPKQYERDAFYIFTPDVMQAFIDSAQSVDAELIENHLYVYMQAPDDALINEEYMSSAVKLVNSIGKELEDQTDYYADERVIDRQQNIIAPAGSRLKKSIGPVSFIVAAVIIFQFVDMFSAFTLGTSFYSYFIILVILISILSLVIHSTIKHRRDKL